tara:strand:- start:618 stop:1205 length:588 start_codon:yes stop_codon:yes gene_type:complete
MKKPDPINKVKHSDEFSSGLMEQFGKWMGGDCFQNTEMPDLHLSEAPFDGMDPQSNGAEIEDTTKKKKSAKKGAYVGQESAKSEEVLEREEFEIDGEVYVLEKVKMDGVDDNGNTSCWKGYKKQGTKAKGGKEVNNCVKAGVEYEGDELTEKKLDPVGKADADIDNDGDVDKSDKFLHARRKKVGKIIAMTKKKK